MEENLDSVVKSLSGNNNELLEFLPYLLQDLFELGGDSNYTINLIEKNFPSGIQNFNVLDLCCGKGAILLQISQKFNCIGTGVDLFPTFISDAKKYSLDFNLQHKLDFKVMNITEAVKTFQNFDIVLFGNDTDVLGNEIQSLSKIKNCSRSNGYIVFDYINIVNSEFENELKNVGLKIIDCILIEKKEIKRINYENNTKIKKRSSELILQFPNKKKLFEDYVKSQEQESLEFEQNLNWTKLLLKKLYIIIFNIIISKDSLTIIRIIAIS